MGRRVNLADLAREPLTDAVPSAPPAEVPQLPVADIASNPLNSREDADMAGDEFDQLVDTIRAHGVLQPIVVCTADAFLERYPDQRDNVRPARWVALIGNRRLLATRAAGQERIPAFPNDDLATSMYEVMLVENAHRRHLGPIREAEAMQRVLDETGMTTRGLGERIGRTHVYIVQRIALLGLIPALRLEFEGGQMKLEQARQLGGLPVPEQEAIVADGPPFRRKSGNGATKRRAAVLKTPATAAEAIREQYTADERAELVRLLTEP